MGSFFKGKTQTSSVQATDPIQQQAFNNYNNALGDVRGMIRPNFMSQLANPVYGGQTYANLDPMQQQYYTGIGQAAGNVFDAGANQYNATKDYGSRLAAFGNYVQDPNAGMNYAAAYANSPQVQAMIDASARDYSRNLFENQLPGLNRGAIGSGNMNSTRAGVMEGLLRSRTAEDIADMSATQRFNAMNQGLGQFNTNVNQQAAMLSQMQNANTAGYNNLANALNMFSSGGQFMRDYNQGMMDDSRNRFYEAQNRPFELAQNYLGLMTPGASFNGGAGVGAGDISQGPSGADKLGQVANIVGTGMTLFCWVAREAYGEHNFKWRMFRHWMFFESPRWFFKLYSKYGESFAKYIHDKPRLKLIVRKLMDRAIKQYGGPHGAI